MENRKDNCVSESYLLDVKQEATGSSIFPPLSRLQAFRLYLIVLLLNSLAVLLLNYED